MINPCTRRFGWKPDTPDLVANARYTDISKFGTKRGGILPRETNNRAHQPVIRDQDESSRCTGFGFTGAAHTRLKILGFDPPLFSARFPYDVGRMLARMRKGEPLIDDGAYPDLVATGIKEYGFALESQFPSHYDISTVNDEPDLMSFSQASQFLLQNFSRIGQVGEHRANAAMQILADGHTIPIGMMVGPAFMDHKGSFPLDLEDPDTIMGGHMTYLIDYEDDGEVFWGVNSYGTGYGYKGLYQITRRRLMHSTTSDLYNMIIIP